MGWGRWLLLGDLGQQLDIEDSREDIERLKRELRATGRRDYSQSEAVAELQKRVLDLELGLASLLRLLGTRKVFTAEELAVLVRLVEAGDEHTPASVDGLDDTAAAILLGTEERLQVGKGSAKSG